MARLLLVHTQVYHGLCHLVVLMSTIHGHVAVLFGYRRRLSTVVSLDGGLQVETRVVRLVLTGQIVFTGLLVGFISHRTELRSYEDLVSSNGLHNISCSVESFILLGTRLFNLLLVGPDRVHFQHLLRHNSRIWLELGLETVVGAMLDQLIETPCLLRSDSFINVKHFICLIVVSLV